MNIILEQIQANGINYQETVNEGIIDKNLKSYCLSIIGIVGMLQFDEDGFIYTDWLDNTETTFNYTSPDFDLQKFIDKIKHNAKVNQTNWKPFLNEYTESK